MADHYSSSKNERTRLFQALEQKYRIVGIEQKPDKPKQ